MPDATGRRLLLVDDDEVLRERLGRALANRGFDVATANGYEEAISIAERLTPNFAVLDLKMPGPSGMELLRDLRLKFPDLRAVLVTGFGSIAGAVEAMRLGAVNYVSKPANADDIVAALGAEIEHEPDLSQDYHPPTLAEAEWEHIHRVLNDCGGNLSEAARLLGIPRRTMQRKLKKRAP